MHFLRPIQRNPSHCPWRDFLWRMWIGMIVTLVIIMLGFVLRP